MKCELENELGEWRGNTEGRLVCRFCRVKRWFPKCHVQHGTGSKERMVVPSPWRPNSTPPVVRIPLPLKHVGSLLHYDGIFYSLMRPLPWGAPARERFHSVLPKCLSDSRPILWLSWSPLFTRFTDDFRRSALQTHLSERYNGLISTKTHSQTSRVQTPLLSHVDELLNVFDSVSSP